MRIAFLANPLDRQYGGIHVYTKELLKALSKLDKKNEYIVIRSESKNEFDGMEEIVVPYLSFPGYRFWRLFVQVPKLLAQKKVDIVVEPAHFGPFNLPKRIKRVTVIHDMTVFLYPKMHVFLSQFLQRKILPGIFKKADLIITNSENTTNDLVQFFPYTNNKISTILLGKNPSFKPQKDPSILTKYKINDPYILFTGTLEPRKNVSTLVRAFDKFKQQFGGSHKLILVGKKGWKTDKIFKSINESIHKKDIINLGYVDKEDLPVLYSMAEVFVYPSVYEGFGLPILEAMACGVPVITSNNSSLPEVGGDAVIYIDPGNESDLSKHITTLCSNQELRKKYSDLGLAQAKKFTWAKTAKQYINTFESLK